jgi:hypothetical protein
MGIGGGIDKSELGAKLYCDKCCREFCDYALTPYGVYLSDDVYVSPFTAVNFMGMFGPDD